MDVGIDEPGHALAARSTTGAALAVASPMLMSAIRPPAVTSVTPYHGSLLVQSTSRGLVDGKRIMRVRSSWDVGRGRG